MLNLRTMLLVAGLCSASAVQAAPAAAQTTITCESPNYKLRDCPAQTGGSVRLERTLSFSRCEYGRTWGFDWNSVWVDRGCRARFQLNGSGSGWESANWGQRVKCESRNGSFRVCRMPTYGYVRLVQQLSQTPCVAGQTWGYQPDRIWVGGGCGGEFELGYGDASWEGDVRVISCQSVDGRYSRCLARTEGPVTLVRQVSSRPCVLQRSWGYDARGVWVDDGCRGVFAVGRGGPGSGWGEYPGTWPGAGGPAGGPVGRGGQACSSEALRRGYQNVSVDNAEQNGSTVYVYLRAYRNSSEFSVGCQYGLSNNRVQITSEDPVTGGIGGIAVVQRGQEACSNRASIMGYQSVYVAGARQNGSNVTVIMTARNQNRGWNLKCIYRQADGTATITQQSEVRS